MTNKTKEIVAFIIIIIVINVSILGYLLLFYHFNDVGMEICTNYLNDSSRENMYWVCSEVNSRVSSAYSTLIQLLILLTSLLITLILIVKSKVSNLEKQIEELRKQINA